MEISFTKGNCFQVVRGQRVPPVSAFSQLPSSPNNPDAYFVGYFGVAYSGPLQKPKNLRTFQNPPMSEIRGSYFMKLINEVE